MKDQAPDDQHYADQLLIAGENEKKERDRAVIPCAIFGILGGILFWNWGKGIHLAPAVIPWLYLLFKCYKFKDNEDLLSQAIRERNLMKLGLTLGLPVITPIILHLLTK